MFCIDRAFAYDKVVLPSRASRSSDTNRREREPPAPAATSSSLSRRGSAASASAGAGVTALAPRQRAPPRGFYTDKGEFDDEEEDRGRNRSSGRKRKGEEENEEDYQDDEGGDDQEVPLPRTWDCSVGVIFPLIFHYNSTSQRILSIHTQLYLHLSTVVLSFDSECVSSLSSNTALHPLLMKHILSLYLHCRYVLRRTNRGHGPARCVVRRSLLVLPKLQQGAIPRCQCQC